MCSLTNPAVSVANMTMPLDYVHTSAPVLSTESIVSVMPMCLRAENFVFDAPAVLQQESVEPWVPQC